MATVIVDFQIRVVDDDLMRKLFGETKKSGNDLLEIPELPGVCLREIKGTSRGGEPLNFSGLLDRIDVAAVGETPTAVLLVRKGDAVNLCKAG